MVEPMTEIMEVTYFDGARTVEATREWGIPRRNRQTQDPTRIQRQDTFVPQAGGSLERDQFDFGPARRSFRVSLKASLVSRTINSNSASPVRATSPFGNVTKT